jgi:putative tricarboxylic transport membrane protein
VNNDQLSSAVWFFIGLGIFVTSISYNVGTPAAPGSGFLAFCSGAAISILSSVGFLGATLKRRQGVKWSSIFRGLQWKNVLIILISIVAFAVLLMPLGFLLTVFVFMVFLLRAIVPNRWSVVIGGALVASIVSYSVFVIGLKAQLPTGPFGF